MASILILGIDILVQLAHRSLIFSVGSQGTSANIPLRLLTMLFLGSRSHLISLSLSLSLSLIHTRSHARTHTLYLISSIAGICIRTRYRKGHYLHKEPANENEQTLIGDTPLRYRPIVSISISIRGISKVPIHQSNCFEWI